MALIDALKESVDDADDDAPMEGGSGPALCRAFMAACKRGDYEDAFEAMQEIVTCCHDGDDAESAGPSLAIMLGRGK